MCLYDSVRAVAVRCLVSLAFMSFSCASSLWIRSVRVWGSSFSSSYRSSQRFFLRSRSLISSRRSAVGSALGLGAGMLGVVRISLTMRGMMRSRAFLSESWVWAGLREEQDQ